MTTSQPFFYDVDFILQRSLATERKRLWRFCAVIATVMAIAMGVIFFTHGFEWQTLLMALYAPILSGAMYISWRFQIRKALSDPRNRIALERQASFDETTFVWSVSDGGRNELPWRSVVGQDRHDQTTLIWINPSQAVYVPDRAWSATDLPRWRERAARLPHYDGAGSGRRRLK